MTSNNPFKQKEDRIFLEVWDKTMKRWVMCPFKVRCFEYEGRIYKLCRVSTFAQALGRTAGTIHRWEREGHIPKPIFTVEGSNHRYYSEDQTRMAAWMQRTILGNDPTKLRGVGLNYEGFFRAVRDNWYEVDFDPKNYEVHEEQTGKNDVKFNV